MGVGVTILVSIIAFGRSDALGTPILTGIVGVGFATLVTVNVCRSLDRPLEPPSCNTCTTARAWCFLFNFSRVCQELCLLPEAEQVRLEHIPERQF